MIVDLLSPPVFMALDSSIVNEVIKTISNQFIIFFLRKDFERTKTCYKQKPTNKSKISNQKNNKEQFFALTKTFKRVKIICFAFWCLFYLQNLFVKILNCLDNLLYYTTLDMYMLKMFMDNQTHL